jgi:anti-sigma regulatory factor (Ser/Thr protein kinase)
MEVRCLGGEPIKIERRDDVCLHLSVPNHTDSLEPARQAVLGFLSGFSLTARSTFNIELILEETLMNAILHAFEGHTEHKIDLAINVRPDEVEMRFEDDGVSFDPLKSPAPSQPATIAAAKSGGRGLMLVRKIAKSVAYRRSDCRNYLTICIARI